jgi:hypothetical protein
MQPPTRLNRIFNALKKMQFRVREIYMASELGPHKFTSHLIKFRMQRYVDIFIPWRDIMLAIRRTKTVRIACMDVIWLHIYR